MTDMSMILHFLFSGVATAGFAVFFNAPLYLLLPAGVTGGIILPLIPGIGLYNTMLSLIQKNYSLAMSKGTDALFLSAAIALGVLVVTSFVRTLNLLKIRKNFIPYRKSK